MYLTGFADEASQGIEGQIAATRELGWTQIESRNVDGKNIHDLSDMARSSRTCISQRCRVAWPQGRSLVT